MAQIKHGRVTYDLPHFKFYRDHKWQPRFEPSPRLRKAGWKGRPLKDELGAWMTIEDAIEKAKEILEKIDAWEAGNLQDTPPAVKMPTQANTIARLFDDYLESPDFKEDIGSSSQTQYDLSLRKISELIPTHVPIAALDRTACIALYNKMRRTYTLSSANYHARVLKRVLKWGLDNGRIQAHPFAGYRLKGTKPRVRFVEEVEIQAMVKTADELGFFTLGSLIISGVVTGQRQGDILKFPITFPTELTNRIKQGKRGKIVNLPEPLLNLLRRRLIQQAEHARSRSPVTPARLFIREATNRPYIGRHDLGRDLRTVRKAAAKTCPSVQGLDELGRPLTDDRGKPDQNGHRFTFADLRDTALTRLILAECTISEACSIMGHEERSALTVWRHYLAQRPEMAENAARKVAAWCEANGISY